MIIRYLWFLIGYDIFYHFLAYFFYPLAYLLRKQCRIKKNWLWGFLNDGNDYGDDWFNTENKKTFWQAYKWSAHRNHNQNRYEKNKIVGEAKNYSGYETCNRDDRQFWWRTFKTIDENGNPAGKNGEYLDVENSILGKQRITFEINDIKLFRYSGCIPRKIGKKYWMFCYKFGFENTNYAFQFQPFVFRSIAKETKIIYSRYEY